MGLNAGMLLKRWCEGGGMLLKRWCGGGMLLKPLEGGGMLKQGSNSSNWEGKLKRFERDLLEYEERKRIKRMEEVEKERIKKLTSPEESQEFRAARQVCYCAIWSHEDAFDWRLEKITSTQFEALLDNLQMCVKYIDVAKKLHSIDRLVPFFHYVLYFPHAGIRAKAAEVVATMVQNNPSSQQLVMEVNGLQHLLYNFISDHDATSRTKALGAISSLIRNNKTGITAFRLANGYAALREALSSENVRLQREVLNLILYLLHENNSDCNILAELGFPTEMLKQWCEGGMLLKQLEGMLKRWEGGMLKQGSNSSNWEGKLKCCDSLERMERKRIEQMEFNPDNSKEGCDLSYKVATASCRVGTIAAWFKVPEDASDLKIENLTSAAFEDLLDELQGYVEYIDVAKKLHSIDRLVPFFHHVLYYPHAGIRAKAAEVVTTMVQNNPSSQQLVMEVNGLQPLLYNFISDHDAISRTKALGAISTLIRNNKTGITAFRLANGYAALRVALSSENVRLQRDVLNLIMYLLHENNLDCNMVTELGYPCIMMHLSSSDDAEVREAALRFLLVILKDEIAEDEGGNNGQLAKYVASVPEASSSVYQHIWQWLKGQRQVPQERIEGMIEGISAMAPEVLSAAREERQLMDSLWNACYKKVNLYDFGVNCP